MAARVAGGIASPTPQQTSLGSTLVDTKLRIVKRLPLEGLWDENGQDLNLHAARELGGDDIRDLIRGGRPVPFVVVNVGSPPRWIHGDQRVATLASSARRGGYGLMML